MLASGGEGGSRVPVLQFYGVTAQGEALLRRCLPENGAPVLDAEGDHQRYDNRYGPKEEGNAKEHLVTLWKENNDK